MSRYEDPMTFEQVREILSLFHEQGVTLGKLQELLDAKLLFDLLKVKNVKMVSRPEFRRVLYVTKEIPTYKIDVDYEQPLTELLEECEFDLVDHRISEFLRGHEPAERMRTGGQAQFKVFLVPVNDSAHHASSSGGWRDSSTHARVDNYLGSLGFRALPSRELLCLAKQHPSLQKARTIGTTSNFGYLPRRNGEGEASHNLYLTDTPSGKRKLALRQDYYEPFFRSQDFIACC